MLIQRSFPPPFIIIRNISYSGDSNSDPLRPASSAEIMLSSPPPLQHALSPASHSRGAAGGACSGKDLSVCTDTHQNCSTAAPPRQYIQSLATAADPALPVQNAAGSDGTQSNVTPAALTRFMHRATLYTFMHKSVRVYAHTCRFSACTNLCVCTAHTYEDIISPATKQNKIL